MAQKVFDFIFNLFLGGLIVFLVIGLLFMSMKEPQSYDLKSVRVSSTFSDSTGCYIIAGKDTINGNQFKNSNFCSLKVGDTLKLYFKKVETK